MKTFQEYVQHKQKHAIDFLIKMCEVPFNQDVKIKLRDKGYQHLHNTMVSKIGVDELWEVLNATSQESQRTLDCDAEADKEVDRSLYKAYP